MAEKKIKIPVYTKTGENSGSESFSANVFGVELNKSVVSDAVLTYLANMRQDTAKTKKRFEVSGGGKKPYRQKGTGRARAGSSRSPLWVGGGTVFGPTGNQNHKLSQNKKEHNLALRCAYSEVVAKKHLLLIDDFNLPERKTKEAVKVLNALKIGDQKVLIILKEDIKNDQFVIAIKNLQSVIIAGPNNVSVYDLLNVEYVLSDVITLREVEEALNK